MLYDNSEKSFDLLEVEVETLRRAALARGLQFDAKRKTYSAKELESYGLVREAYNSEELSAWGLDNKKVVTCFDEIVAKAKNDLLVDAPFALTIKKWQLPIDLSESRSLMSEFPPNTLVKPHVHPSNTDKNPGGSLRIVLDGEIEYSNKLFTSGDWFYIPNGVPYSFRTHATNPTRVFYSYAFFAPSMGNRFSYPVDTAQEHARATSVA